MVLAVVGQYEVQYWSHCSFKPFVSAQGNARRPQQLLCHQNWPITNASKGLPLAAQAKWFQTLAPIILRHCCSSLATSQTQQVERQRGEKGLCFTKLAAAFYACARREWRTGVAQSRADQHTEIAGSASSTFLLGQESLQPRCLNDISVSQAGEAPFLMKEDPLLQFLGDLSGQNMFGGAVICIAGGKKSCCRSGWNNLTAGQPY